MTISARRLEKWTRRTHPRWSYLYIHACMIRCPPSSLLMCGYIHRRYDASYSGPPDSSSPVPLRTKPAPSPPSPSISVLPPLSQHDNPTQPTFPFLSMLPPLPLPLPLPPPLLRRKALWRPRMNGLDLLLERGVDQPMPRQRRLLLELRRHDDRRVGLAASACTGRILIGGGEGGNRGSLGTAHILNLDVLGAEFGFQAGFQRGGGYARGWGGGVGRG